MGFLKISCFLIVICGILADDENQWLKFKEDYNKTYSSPEDEESHKQAFFSNVKLIEKHNEDYKNGKSSYEMEINEFADMLPGDFKENSMLDFEDGLESFIQVAQRFNQSSVPDYVNWVERGYSNPALKQGRCGSCYAFSTVAAIEAQYFIKQKELIYLSEQDIVNCGRLYGSFGCEGGVTKRVFKMVKKRGVLFSKDEPYTAVEDICKAPVLDTKDNTDPYVKIGGYGRVEKNNEEALKEAVANIGPIAVDINYAKSLRFYKQGIYYEPNCDKDVNLHSLLIVGYGTREGKDFWIVRNSWGENWGVFGHALMSRNRGNNCNIANRPFYPIDPVINSGPNEIE